MSGLRSVGLLFLLLALGTPVLAQTNPDSVKWRNNCRLAAQVLETGHPRPQYEWARDYIMLCEEEAPPVLATRWRTVRADTLDLRYLIAASERVRDRRIYERLHEVVLDRFRPDAVRVGAMIVLMKFVKPSNAYSFPDLAPPPGRIQVIRMRSASTTHPVQTPGPVPLGGPVGRPVLELLERIAAERETESRPVWYAAAVLAKTLAFDLRHGSAQ